MSSRNAIIDERVRQLQAALAEAQQAAESAQSQVRPYFAEARQWEARARAAEEFIARLERDIRVGLIRSLYEVEDAAHAYQPPRVGR